MTRQAQPLVTGALPAVYLERLAGIFGPGRVVTDPAGMEKYGRDETEGMFLAPRAVVLATDAREVSALLSLSTAFHVPVTPRTGGTGVTGGALPAAGGVVLSLERMNSILEIDSDNMAAVVQPGVITGVLHRAVEEKRLFYPPDPASLDSCTIGGNVAECAGGPRAVKYGVTGHFVTGLECVLPTGEITRWGGKVKKDVAGYDVASLIVGSEGTLAVVTEVTLRLIPLPPARADLLAPFPDLCGAARCASAVAGSAALPAAIEFMDGLCIRAAGDFLGRLPRGVEGAGAALLLTIDGRDSRSVAEGAEEVGGICMDSGALDVFVAGSSSEKDRLWEMRRKLREALLARCRSKFSEDVAVPPSVLGDLVEGLRAIELKFGVEIACFGHAGDGNVHVNVLRGSQPEPSWPGLKRGIMEEIFRLSSGLGGTLSGEHGIGLAKRDFMGFRFDQAQMALFRRLKAAFDPAGILNPLKIF